MRRRKRIVIRTRREENRSSRRSDSPLSFRRDDISVLELVVDFLDSHSDGVLVEFLLTDVGSHDGCRKS